MKIILIYVFNPSRPCLTSRGFKEKEMIYTLEDLREGKVGIEMGGEYPDKLNTVIRHFTPLAPRYFGISKYVRHENDSWYPEDIKRDMPYQLLDIFYEQLQQLKKLPKEHEFKFGDKVLCWDSEEETKGKPFRFVAKVDSEYTFIVIDEQEFRGFKSGIQVWNKPFKFCKIFPSPLKITRSEIAEKFGTDHFEIVDQ